LDDEEDMTKIFWDVKYSLIQAEIILKGLKRVHENMLKKMGITQKEMREYDAVMDSINLNYSEEVGKNWKRHEEKAWSGDGYYEHAVADVNARSRENWVFLLQKESSSNISTNFALACWLCRSCKTTNKKKKND